ncbi:MAG: ABC transporter ATP-binding protein [Alphaproteobacteria bacterium]|nr:MAG: ABC transporter ATP-binding protein [Alphaproteobacteria bacterium]
MTFPTDSSPALLLRGLRKTYPPRGRAHAKEALCGIDLEVPQGSLFALLGPNGAGKSTLINILAGLVRKTSGTAHICGYEVSKNPRQARRSIGVVPQELVLDPFFSPREILEMQAGLYGVPKNQRRTLELLDIFGLSDKLPDASRSLSGGMRRRLMVAKALVHNPPVLVLDEPTAGVDVELRQTLWAYVRKLNAQGTTVLLTTHYLEEAEELCDHIAIINHGHLVASESKVDLLRRLDSKEVRLTLAQDMATLPPSLTKLGMTQESPRQITLRYQPSRQPIGILLDAVRAAGIEITDLTSRESDLEDIFLQLTRRDRTAA